MHMQANGPPGMTGVQSGWPRPFNVVTLSHMSIIPTLGAYLPTYNKVGGVYCSSII